MLSNKMDRRKFMKNLSATVLGVTAFPWLKGASHGKPEQGTKVEHRTLGRTGLKVTSVSMGVMNCSDPAVLHRAFDLGINFYDTADCYMRGKNEELVGKVFEGKRTKVFIQTKVHPDNERKMRASVETSLRRLRTDYIDVLVWHGHSSPEEVSDPTLFEFMAKMKKEGKTRFAGFATHRRMNLLLREAAKSNFHDVAMVSYNFTHSKDMRDAIALAAKSGIGVIAMKTQAGGYKKEKMGGLNPHQAALKYALMDQNVSCAVPGVTTVGEIEECAAVMGTFLSKRNLNELSQYQSFLEGRICTLCGGCRGECPDEASRFDLLRVAAYHDGYQNDPLVKETLDGNPRLKDRLPCSDCSSCSVICRRGLDLKAQIKKAHALIVRG
jgi:aryl-alcohol dehydrogenase-like predicted oxidoreductase/NAD-dependent dihydropyrimidine dehydrogenase PreA subunit